MRSPRCILMLLLAGAFCLALAGAATAETIFAYYPFDTATANVTPDDMLDHDLTLGGTTSATIDGVSMFGAGAAKSTTVTGYAQLADGDADFDTTYTKLSVSLWAKANWTGTGFGNRYLTGKYATGGNRGWQLNHKGGAEVGQINFGGYQGPLATDPNQNVTTTLTSNLDPDVFHNIVATFDASETSTSEQFRIYIDGIRQTTTPGTASVLTQLNGANANPFQVLNRGATATSTTSGGGFIGSIDDYVIASGDSVLTDKQVALIHGLGRLDGVNYASGSSVGDELGDVLVAYDTQGSAWAGGDLWYYQANVGGGTTVGAIGGTVAGGDAYIVLGTDGSGVTLIPEPATLLLLLFTVAPALGVRRRP